MEFNTISLDNLDTEISDDLFNEINNYLITLSQDSMISSNDLKSDNLYNIDINILKKMVVRWIKLDDTIKEYNKDIKDFKDEKVQLEDKIISFMNKNEQNEILVKDGKVEKKASEKKEPINEEYIKKCLVKSVDDLIMIDKITNMIISSREITETYKLSRKVTKVKKEKK
jgi:hypothetical protein